MTLSDQVAALESEVASLRAQLAASREPGKPPEVTYARHFDPMPLWVVSIGSHTVCPFESEGQAQTAVKFMRQAIEAHWPPAPETCDVCAASRQKLLAVTADRDGLRMSLWARVADIASAVAEAVAKEREACAEICERMVGPQGDGSESDSSHDISETAWELALRIRSRPAVSEKTALTGTAGAHEPPEGRPVGSDSREQTGTTSTDAKCARCRGTGDDGPHLTPNDCPDCKGTGKAPEAELAWDENRYCVDVWREFIARHTAEAYARGRREALEEACRLVESRRMRVLNTKDDPSWTEHFQELEHHIRKLGEV